MEVFMLGMKGRVKRIAVLIAIITTLIGCAGPGNDPAGKSGRLPGKFSATALSDSFGGQARGVSLGNYTVSNSKSIYFILRNVGDFPITNIQLTPGKLLANGGTFAPITDNGVTASPGTISVLETSGNTTVETIIEVDINHGNVVGLISQQYIQKADFAGATIRITGKTTDEDNAVVNVSLDVDIGTLIKVASFEFQCSTDGITWQTIKYDWNPHYNKCYSIPNASKNYVKILNTGNVPLKYKAGINQGIVSWENDNEWKDLNSGERSENLALSKERVFIIDTIGVAFDTGDDGYFSFRPNTSIVIYPISNLIEWEIIN